MKKSQIVSLLIQAVRPAIRQQIKQFFIPAVQKIIQNQFKKFKMSQKIISDSNRTMTQNRRTIQQPQTKQQVQSRLKQRLGIDDFDPRQFARQSSPIQPQYAKQQNVDQYLGRILGGVSQQPMTRGNYQAIQQDTDFDPMSFDAPQSIINQSKYQDPYAFEQDLDDIDQTMGYRDSIADNPAIAAKLGLKIKR